MTGASAAQISAIHALKARAGLDEPSYRAFLEGFGARSSKELTPRAAARAIDQLKELAGQGAGPKGSVAGLDSPVARKLRALWIAAWNLGLARDRSDRAMLTFLERQAGVSHTRFLREPGAGTAAIEGLKGWLARDGKVAWPAKDDAAARGARRAVLLAQWARLAALGAVMPPESYLEAYARTIAGHLGWEGFQAADYDAVQAALGRKLRAELEAERARR